MFPSRFSFKRCILILIILATLLLLFLNTRQSEWTSVLNGSLGGPRSYVKNKERLHAAKQVEKADSPIKATTKSPTSTASERRRQALKAKKTYIETEHVVIIENDLLDKRKRPANQNRPTSPESRPWFMKGGKRWPKASTRNRATHRRVAKLFPHEDPKNDRIINQLMYIPPNYDKEKTRFRKILLYNGLGAWGLNKPGKALFRECPVSTCSITANRNDATYVDAILFKDHFTQPYVKRPMNQIWILYFLECPYHTPHINFADVMNWTATYRSDSDIVTPYERWAYYDDKIKQKPFFDRNYAENKTRKVAWFVSNCGARNGRLQYARDLQKYIDVDIYGACGNHKCSRSSANKCFDLLDRHYKFYLAFENSNCKNYITEKFFVNGLGRDILPIAMGARPEDYKRAAPYKSYIHVDEFESPKQLADYLHILDNNDDMYNSYFRWKGTGEFINTYFWCRLCAMLHDDVIYQKYYVDINNWWRWSDVCTNESWRSQTTTTTSTTTHTSAKPHRTPNLPINSDNSYY